MNIDQQAVRRIERKIERIKETIARHESVVNAPFQSLGSFVTGRSNRPASLDRQVNAENRRHSESFRIWKKATDDLKFWQHRLEAIKSGEVHPNGQVRKDAPSRKRRADARVLRAEFLRWWIPKVGMKAGVGYNSVVTIIRLNKKSATEENGERWTYHEVFPVDVDGNWFSDEETRQLIKQWLETDGS